MAEDADIDRQVAARLRQVRLDRGLTLSRLAEVTGISTAHLSRIETGERQPSVGSLLQLARAYGTSIGALVENAPEQDYHLVRAGAATVHDSGGSRYEVLSGPQSLIAVVTLELAAGGSTDEARHAGEEWLQALDGPVLLRLDKHDITLGTGDSVQFESSAPHSLHNQGTRPARALIVSSASSLRHPVTGIPPHG
jgi:transcriptional regulator with XRE-family HTH domain